MNKNNLMWVGVGLAIILGVIGTFKHQTIVQPIQTQFGGTSPDISSPYVDFGGVRHWYATASLNQASTTVCSLPAPLATSTLVFASVSITTSTTTNTVWDFGKSQGTAATTTVLSSTALTGGLMGTIVASTTTAGSGPDSPVVFGAAVASTSSNLGNIYVKQNYLNVIYGGTQGALNVFTGSCKAEWIQSI